MINSGKRPVARVSETLYDFVQIGFHVTLLNIPYAICILSGVCRIFIKVVCNARGISDVVRCVHLI